MDETTRQQGQPRQISKAGDLAAVDWFARWQVKLEPGEVFLNVWRDSLLILFLRMFPPLLLAAMIVVLFALVFQRTTLVERLLFGLLLPLSFIVLAWLSAAMLRWYFRIYVLTNRRLIRREGIIWRTRLELSLPKVQNAAYSAATIQKWLGLGTVRVETASVGPAFRMDNVRHAPEIGQQILKAADEAKYQRALMEEDQVRRMLAETLISAGKERMP